MIWLNATSLTISQTTENFSGLYASGKIPKDFTTKSYDKSERDYLENEDKDLDKDFFLSTRYYIDELLLSGNILFNEKLSKYLNRVASYTLRAENSLKDELRFYVLKSTTANAFSTDQGIIVFTTELLAQLENEAQLAYIIAHEVSHYIEHHVKESYVERQTLEKGKGKYYKMDHESKVAALSVYNKSSEFEADEKGVDIYMNTEYDVDEIYTSFEMLLYSYLPFEDFKFESTFLNSSQLIIPGSYFIDTLNKVSKEFNYDDLNSSHPNIEKRMNNVIMKVGTDKSKGNKKFVISEKEFREVQNLARFENVSITLSQREYGKAIYLSYLLQKEFPNNRFLDLSLVKSLYGLAKYKNANRFSEVSEKPQDIEGESYVLHLFLSDISKDFLNVLAYRFAYDMAEKYMNDSVFKAYEKDMKKELAVRSKFDFTKLKDKAKENYLKELKEVALDFDIEDSLLKIEESDMSKYQKIRRKKELNALRDDLNSSDKVENNDFYLYALHDLVRDKNLIDELENIKKEHEESQQQVETSKEGNKEGENVFKKIVIVDPIFEQFKVNRKKDLIKSERKKEEMSALYDKVYPKLNMKTELLDSKMLTPNSVDEYNALGIMLRWVKELMKHQDIEMICSSNDRVANVKKMYGTEHFLFTGAFAIKQRNEAKAVHFYSILFPYLIPIAVADLLITHNNFELITFVANVDKDEIVFANVADVKLKLHSRVLQAYIYDVMYQLNQVKK